MIDHFRRYDTEAEALTDPLVAAYRTEDGWDTSRVIPGGTVRRVTGTETVTDPDTGEEREQEITVAEPWWYLTIMLPHVDQALADDPATMMVTDREAAARDDPDWILVSRIPPEDWPLYRPDTVPAGSRYPIGKWLSTKGEIDVDA